MKYSLNGTCPLSLFADIVSQSTVGLVGHLKTHFLAMYRLYNILKAHTDPSTDEELAIMLGEKVLDVEAADTYLGQVEVASVNLLFMFAKQLQENVASKMLGLSWPSARLVRFVSLF